MNIVQHETRDIQPDRIRDCRIVQEWNIVALERDVARRPRPGYKDERLAVTVALECWGDMQRPLEFFFWQAIWCIIRSSFGISRWVSNSLVHIIIAIRPAQWCLDKLHSLRKIHRGEPVLDVSCQKGGLVWFCFVQGKQSSACFGRRG